MFVSFSDTSCIMNFPPIVGPVVARSADASDFVCERGADAGTAPHDELARFALAPDQTVAATPCDDLARLGLCRRGDPSQGRAAGDRWNDAWM
jgi:hypothetical protein